jgi:hypothetical protein
VPDSNAVDAPLNTRLVVRDVVTTSEIAGELELRSEDGTAVVLTLEVVRDWGGDTVTVATPTEPLSAGTRYEVFLRPILAEECGQVVQDCFGSELAAVSSFTTGASVDTLPPSFAESATVSEQTEEVCVDCSCDFNWGTAYRSFGWPDATDDSGTILYNIYANGELQNILRASSGARVGLTCWGNDVQSRSPASIGFTEGDYMAVAVDIAGNETASMPLALPAFDCTEIDEENPNNSESPGEAPGGGTSSASCASSSGETTLVGALFVLFALGRRREDRHR